MGYHVRREGRPSNDRQIHGGPLTQKDFTGGVNMDRPASELAANQVAYAENVIFRRGGPEARPGSVRYSGSSFSLDADLVYAYEYSPLTIANTYATYRHCFAYNGAVRWYPDSPDGTYVETSLQTPGVSQGLSGTLATGTGDMTMLPYRRGMILFTLGASYGLLYAEPGYGWKLNSPNPVAGVKDQSSGSGHRYRVLMTLSRITTYTQDAIPAFANDRLAAGAVLEHESGTNAKAYADSAGTAVISRTVDFGTITRATAISVASPIVIPYADLAAAFSSAADSDDNAASSHWTHASLYITADLDAAGPDGARGNEAVFVWAGDVRRDTVFGPANYSIAIDDNTIRQRILDGSLLLKSRFLEPLPNGDCGEITPGFLFIADRSNAYPETKLSYSPLAWPEHIGYYMPRTHEHNFKDGIRGLRANGDVLSIFCNNSTHTCTLTAITEQAIGPSLLQVLTHWREADKSIGVRDWGTICDVDKTTLIAVCSDATVRLWDTERWGDDLAEDAVSSEIRQIVPASPSTYARGSYAKFWGGAYYLWYSKNSADTCLANALRLAVRKRAGLGWGPYTGWAKLPFKRGAVVIIDGFGIQRLIAITQAATSGSYVADRLYWLETYDLYSGATEQSGNQAERKDVDAFVYGSPSSGAEVVPLIRLREFTASKESIDILHQESHFYWRPQVEADGFRSGFSVTVKAYKNGSVTAQETLLAQPKTGDIRFTKEIFGHRIQLEVSANRGACRLVGTDSLCRALDRPNYLTAGSNETSESTTNYPHWQKNLAGLNGGLVHWITRRDYLWDRAKGVLWTGSGSITQNEGPDGKTSSLNFNSSSLSVPSTSTYIANFAFVFSVKLPGTDYCFQLAAGGVGSLFRVRFTGGNIDVNGNTFAVTLGVWDTFCIYRTGTTVTVLQNGASVGTFTSSTVYGGGALTIGFPSGTGEMFDIRTYTSGVDADELAYYWAELNDHDGDAVLPLM